MIRSRRPRRVLLFCPATERKKIEKAAGLGVDAVILDLEDAVPPGRKSEARETAARCLEEIDFGTAERLVRLNPAASGLQGEDIRRMAGGRRPPDGFLIPKVESPGEIRTVARLLKRHEGRGRGSRRFALLALVESARGVVHVGAIAAADPRLEALAFGAEDLCADLGGLRTREGREVLYARSAVALHCAAAGLQAIDTPHLAVREEAGLIAETRDALALGYSGKLAIHPAQVGPILSVFTPASAEIEAALALLREHERQRREGRGVFVWEGRMVDMPMIRAAENLLARARRAGLHSPERGP